MQQAMDVMSPLDCESETPQLIITSTLSSDDTSDSGSDDFIDVDLGYLNETGVDSEYELTSYSSSSPGPQDGFTIFEGSMQHHKRPSISSVCSLRYDNYMSNRSIASINVATPKNINIYQYDALATPRVSAVILSASDEFSTCSDGSSGSDSGRSSSSSSTRSSSTRSSNASQKISKNNRCIGDGDGNDSVSDSDCGNMYTLNVLIDPRLKKTKRKNRKNRKNRNTDRKNMNLTVPNYGKDKDKDKDTSIEKKQIPLSSISLNFARKCKFEKSASNEQLIDALPDIVCKFDALFPFYRMTDKDCKQLSLMVYSCLNKINRIFCNSIARSLEVIIYYKGSFVPEKIVYFNGDDDWDEVKQWKDIMMNQEYCLKNIDMIAQPNTPFFID